MTENNYLYAGEQFDKGTELYYLRARYMEPSTGTFISMDTYQGNMHDPQSLHKYMYANASPVMFKDPTGNYSLAEMSASMSILSILNSIAILKYFKLVIVLSTMLTLLFSTLIFLTADYISDILRGVKTSDDITDDSENGIKDNSIEGDLEDIAGDYGLLKCIDAANALSDNLRKNGKRGYKIEIIFENPLSDNIVSISKGDLVISTNAYHVGVEYNGIVYCNVHPSGLPTQQWISDFEGTGTKRIKRTKI